MITNPGPDSVADTLAGPRPVIIRVTSVARPLEGGSPPRAEQNQGRKAHAAQWSGCKTRKRRSDAAGERMSFVPDEMSEMKRAR